jgi:organic hydroperoxide reductase OsmC/OhrA
MGSDAGSSSPFVVPVPWSDPAAPDPDEAFGASLSSCHMLGGQPQHPSQNLPKISVRFSISVDRPNSASRLTNTPVPVA